RIPSWQRDRMARLGNPVEWLATDKSISVDEAVVQLRYRTQWYALADVTPDEFREYLSERTQLVEQQLDLQRISTVRRATAKVGRNVPCPCGSGRKYKRCCGSTSVSPDEIA